MLDIVVIFSATKLGDLLELKVVLSSLSPSKLEDDALFVDADGAIVGVSSSVSPVRAMSRSFSFDRMSFREGIVENFVDGMVTVASVCAFEVSYADVEDNEMTLSFSS